MVAVGQEHSLNDTIVIPVSMGNMEEVVAISLSLKFDDNNFSFIDLKKETTGIGQEIIPNIIDNELKIGWFSLNPVDFEQDTLINLRFLRINGCFTFLTWDLETPGACQITTLTEQDLAVEYTDGVASFLITDQPEIIFPSEDAEVNPFNVDFSWNSAKCTNAYRVQISQDTDFSTVEIDTFLTALQLEILALSPLTTYYWRVAKEDTRKELFWSASARFKTRASVLTTASLVGQSTVATQFDIPVVIKNRSDIDSFSIAINYNENEVQFLGFQSQGLTNFSLDNIAGKLQFKWSGEGSDWQSDTLCLLQFQKLTTDVAICSSSLQWDNNSQFFKALEVRPAAFNDRNLSFRDGAPVLDCPADILLKADGSILSDESEFIETINTSNCQTLEVAFKGLSMQPDCDFLELTQNFDAATSLELNDENTVLIYEALDKAGNKSTCQLEVKVEPLVVETTIDNRNPCKGEIVNFSTTIKDAELSWIAPNNELISTEADFEYALQLAGIYKLQATLENGCIVEDAIQLSFPQKPVINLSYESTDCQAEQTAIQLFIGQADSLDNLEWEDVNGNVWNETNPTIDNLPNNFEGIYYLNYQKEGCSFRDSIEVVINNKLPLPDLSISATEICLEQELFLVSQSFNSDNITYSWEILPENESVIILGNRQQQSWMPNTVGNYTLKHSVDINGCLSDTIEQAIIVTSPPQLSPSIEGNVACVDGTSNIQLLSNIEDAVSWQWKGVASNFYSEEENPLLTEVSANQSDIFELKVTTKAGCESSAFLDLEITDGILPPTITRIGDPCPRGLMQLQTALIFNATYQWFAPSGLLAGNASFLPLSNQESGTYRLLVQKDNCTQETSFEVDLLADLSLSDDLFDISIDELKPINLIENDELATNSSFQIELLSTPIHGDLSEIGKGAYEYSPNSAFPETDAFVYSICYDDCPDICDEAVVRLNLLYPEDQCVVTTVFSPNNDGINDAFFISCLDRNTFPESRLIIYNQWGKTIHEASPYENDWEGTIDGQQVGDGTYYYLFYRDKDSPVQKGHFMIYR